MKGTKEFYELISQFEKDFRESDMYISANNPLKRSSKEDRSFYDNGAVNQMFYAYMMGFSYGKSLNAQTL